MFPVEPPVIMYYKGITFVYLDINRRQGTDDNAANHKKDTVPCDPWYTWNVSLSSLGLGLSIPLSHGTPDVADLLLFGLECPRKK